MIANAYFLERQSDAACHWNGLALGLSPANESYLKFKRDQDCP